MDDTPMTFTSLALIVLLVFMLVMFICHFLGPRATTWLRSNKEEKIGLSKNKLFHANGYMLHSGSEFLLSSSGSFKRFDTIDKEGDYKQPGQQSTTQQQTTSLWNLPQQSIPPQPLRPAPAPRAPPDSAPPTHVKTVTFSFITENETAPLSGMQHHVNGHPNLARISHSGTLVSCMRGTSAKATPTPQPIGAPPPSRLPSSSSTVALSATAIPRPVAKRQTSLQSGMTSHAVGRRVLNTEDVQQLPTRASSEIIRTTGSSPTKRQPGKLLTRRNSSTNPFLCESLESLHEKIEPNTALQTHTNNNNNNNKSAIAQTSNGNNSSNPFYDEATNTSIPNDQQQLISSSSKSIASENSPISTEKPTLQEQSFRNRSFSETEATESDLKTFSSKIATASLLKLSNTTNPFTGITQRVKGPHMLQKTISEDFLFRKLGVNHTNANGGGQNAASGGSTWTFGRTFMRQDSTWSLGRRNSSQCSLDSAGLGSMDSINLERAISCDSVNSDSSVFLNDLDQPYTQITGYLCVDLHYDKNSNTDEGMELTVTVLEAKALICPFSVDSLDTFVRIYLVPDQAGAMQTKIFKDSKTPSYNESFNFWLKKKHGRHSLWFHLYHNGLAHTLIGEAEMEIDETPRSITTWIPLSDSRKCNAHWGELMFSLSYLPTAERLTIVVVKARNLKMEVRPSGQPTTQEVHSVFVKVYLMNNEKKVSKKRTSLKRKDRSPIFNESVIFSVPPQSLTTVQLRLTVFGVIGEGGAANNAAIVPLGHVLAGSCSTGKGLRHWHQMLSSLRKPVAMWHVLRRATNQPVFTGGAEAVVAAMQSTALRAKRNSVI